VHYAAREYSPRRRQAAALNPASITYAASTDSPPKIKKMFYFNYLQVLLAFKQRNHESNKTIPSLLSNFHDNEACAAPT
jgi:hypothetical protein